MPSASPALSSSNYLFGNRRPHRSSFDGYSQPPTPIGAKKELQSRLDTNPLLPHSPSSDRNSGAQAARNHSSNVHSIFMHQPNRRSSLSFSSRRIADGVSERGAEFPFSVSMG